MMKNKKYMKMMLLKMVDAMIKVYNVQNYCNLEHIKIKKNTYVKMILAKIQITFMLMNIKKILDNVLPNVIILMYLFQLQFTIQDL